MTKPALQFSFAALVCLLIASPASARPPYKQALVAHFGPLFPAKLNDCRLCHVPGEVAEGEDKPRNLFGDEMELAGYMLESDGGNPDDIPARFQTVIDADSDGDGVANLKEILLGTFPGDDTNTPDAAALSRSEEMLASYDAHLNRYRWTPWEPLQRPDIPAVAANSQWIRNPIDAFIASGHQSQGLTPQPEADRRTLIRRVTFDLTGLPPTAEEIQAFCEDDRPDAYERLVDRLLDSPRYGERWGRHWMDVWRYSDWSGWIQGNDVRDSQPHIWRWRDWIVESLNEDKPYDQMVLEMLAADELLPGDEDALRATGYLVRNFKKDRQRWLQDVVDHSFLAFQAVTIGCARCHDHMFDPLTQREYYEVRAIFEPHQVRTDHVRGSGEYNTKNVGLVRAFDAEPDAATYLLLRGDIRTPDESAPLQPGVPAAYGPPFPQVTPVSLPVSDYRPEARRFVIEAEVEAARNAVEEARAALEKARSAKESPESDAPKRRRRRSRPDSELLALDLELAEAKLASLLATIAADDARESSSDSADASELARAAKAAQNQLALVSARKTVAELERDQKQEDAEKLEKARESLKQAEELAAMPAGTDYSPREVKTFPDHSTGRRLAFARWLTDRRNPLTARVAVNHIWLRHFGSPLVPSVFDFGTYGREPVNPALVDWLAAELMERDWSMKSLHRLILTSSAYRMSSKSDESKLAIDPDNNWLWRMSPQRLEAEAVRDHLLFVAGELDLTMGGPEIDEHEGMNVPRRSLYFRHAAGRQMEFLKIFDAASVTECYQRRESVIPQQALALANSPLSAKMARVISEGLRKDVGDPAQFAEQAFERILGRPPRAEELSEAIEFITSQDEEASEETDIGGSLPERRCYILVLSLLNHHEFVTVL